MNETYLNATMASTVGTPEHRSSIFPIVIKVIYAIGIIGNAIAIVALRVGERRVRNRKHLLLLTTLATNDLIALVGMMCSMMVSESYPWVRSTRTYCITRVLLRAFGIGSVCIAVTMGLERYLALTRPFLYQKRVTYYIIRRALLASWIWAVVLTCFPIFKFGAYYDEKHLTCIRYRMANTTTEKIYAYIYVSFGTFLCVILVYCNLAVIQALYAITAPRNGAQPVVRRVSKSSCRQGQKSLNAGSGNNLSFHHNAATAEEVAFSRLMATFSVLFMICWLPQMGTSALYLTLDKIEWKTVLDISTMVSDLLMLLNYVLDPYLYVLMRQRRRLSTTAFCHSITHCFKSHKTSSDSMKTSCCPETVVVSENSGSELRPLRGFNPPQPACATILKLDE